MSEDCLLVLTVTPELEEAIVDWLLSRECPTGFSSAPVNGHSTDQTHLTVAEQVRGSRRQVQFQIQVPRETARSCLQDLRRDFAGAGMHYWLLPLLEGGHLG